MSIASTAARRPACLAILTPKTSSWFSISRDSENLSGSIHRWPPPHRSPLYCRKAHVQSTIPHHELSGIECYILANYAILPPTSPLPSLAAPAPTLIREAFPPPIGDMHRRIAEKVEKGDLIDLNLEMADIDRHYTINLDLLSHAKRTLNNDWGFVGLRSVSVYRRLASRKRFTRTKRER
ncbi:hypothetical protein K402DRAFT_45478 [Aulographum hederae CBS 113979]|uniref:Uncharacterized protein n=1 Tax=Aulographum hederae CBS 113979 TaxID=1176131 RepID=A0A6G1H3Z4_9PEZI|nr:hypothetical protein K402DRAFT_45478 [Aulographum hederae CBS 113979]